MDKSEGKDFLSKTFSSVTEKVAKYYKIGQEKLSLSSLKRSRSERITELGDKVFSIVKNGETLSNEQVLSLVEKIKKLDEQIQGTISNIDKMDKYECDSSVDTTPKSTVHQEQPVNDNTETDNNENKSN